MPPLSLVEAEAVEGNARLTQLAAAGGCSLLPSLTSPTAVPLDALEHTPPRHTVPVLAGMELILLLVISCVVFDCCMYFSIALF